MGSRSRFGGRRLATGGVFVPWAAGLEPAAFAGGMGVFPAGAGESAPGRTDRVPVGSPPLATSVAFGGDFVAAGVLCGKASAVSAPAEVFGPS